ncbi:Glyco_tranf_GTA_type domain containing protein [uncultured Caudovirales phage]|uniref:Glyco_tranf_GTA_type domain containing protein n=1 Tax=uncultured Caudovirales phage TaxID=2100421 RepID=A0A6J7WNZ9_9CAUD|nr:Glyco_tranf_GTA_type domain containing protein [uncultured Caudovirales phage]
MPVELRVSTGIDTLTNPSTLEVTMAIKGKVAVAWIDPGTVTTDFATSMIRLFRSRSNKVDNWINVRSGGALPRARNEAVDQFLKNCKEDWLLFIDSDMVFTPFEFDVLCEAAHSDKTPVIGGLCFAQDGTVGPFPGLMPTLYVDAGNGGGYNPIWNYPPNKLVEVDATGAAFILIHRKVLETIRTTSGDGRWSWFGEHTAKTIDAWVSEDITFCERIKASGFPIHVHTGAKIGHYKGHNYLLNEPMYQVLMASRANA